MPVSLAFATILAACGSAAAPSSAPSAASGSSAVASSSAAAASAGAKPERSQVTVSYNTNTGVAAFLLIAAKQNLGQKYGITIEPRFIGGPAAVAALMSGDTQFQIAGGPAPIQAMASGAPIKMIASFDNVNGYGIYGRKGVNSLADLKGGTVAVAGKGDNTDVSLRAALKKSGSGVEVDKDVAEVQVGHDADRVAALQTGRVDAAILDEGAAGPQAEAVGAHDIYSLKQQHISWATGLMVSDSYARENPNTVLAVLQSLIDGIHFLTTDSNRATVTAIMAADMKLSPDDQLPKDAYETYTHREGVFNPTAGATSILDALKSIDPSKYGSTSPDRFIDLSYLNKLQAAGLVKIQD